MKKKRHQFGAFCGVVAGSVMFTAGAGAGISIHTDRINDFDATNPNAGPNGIVTWDGTLDGISETYGFTYSHPEYTLTFDLDLLGLPNNLEIHPTGGTNDLRVEGGGFIGAQTHVFSLSNFVVTDAPGGFPNPVINSATLTTLQFAAAAAPDDEGIVSTGIVAATPWDDLGGGASIITGETTNNIALDIFSGIPANSLLGPGITAPIFGVLSASNQYQGGTYRIESIGFQIAVNIPEPSRAMLLMLGGCGIVMRRRRS